MVNWRSASVGKDCSALCSEPCPRAHRRQHKSVEQNSRRSSKPSLKNRLKNMMSRRSSGWSRSWRHAGKSRRSMISNRSVMEMNEAGNRSCPADRCQKMHIRHSNMLAQAHFLQTTAEPKLVSWLRSSKSDLSLMDLVVLQAVGIVA